MKHYFFKIKTLCHKLLRNNDGVAAVEFALLFPVLIVIFVGSVDISHYLKTDRQLTNAASLIGDRISQMPNNGGVAPSATIDAGDLVAFANVIRTTLPAQSLANIEIRIEIFARDVRKTTANEIRVHEYRRSLLRLRNFNASGPQNIGVNLTQNPAATANQNETDPWANDSATLLNPDYSNSELSEEMQADGLQGNGTIRDYIRVQVETSYKSPFGTVFNVDTNVFEEYITVPRMVNFVTMTNNAGFSLIP